MNVLLFTLEYPPFKGGVANYYENITKFWPKQDNIFVLNNNENKLLNKKLPFLKWLPAVWQLFKNIKKYNINHILVGHILPLGTTAYLVSKIIKINYSVFLHGMDFTFACKTPRKKWLIIKILNNADNVICGNSYVAKLLVSAGITTKIPLIINPGINIKQQIADNRYLELLKNKYDLKNKIILLSIGRLIKRKGFDKVIEAMPKVLQQIPNLIYFIIGNGEEIINYELKIKNLELNKNIIIIQNVDNEKRNTWYHVCDIFIMPSRNINNDFEGFGIVYLEANLAGKPVIAGNSGGVCDAVKHCINGLMVNPENVDEISCAIIKLSKNKDLRKKLGEQGKRRVIKEFRWEKQINIIYNNIIK